MFIEIKLWLLKSVISKLLLKMCPSSVPRSGAKGEQVNCFHIYLEQDGDSYFVINRIASNHVSGLWWNGENFCEEASVPFNWFKLSQIKIMHYFSLSEFTYRGIFDYLISGLTKYNEAKAILLRYINIVKQYFFNRRPLVMVERLELLRVILEHYIQTGEKDIKSIDLMSRLYSIRWIVHPDKNMQEKKLILYLDSFVESGDLICTNRHYSYTITGKALLTLDEYEESERRHQDNVRLQRLMVLLTLIMAFFTMVQADLIKLPTLFDFTNLFGNGK